MHNDRATKVPHASKRNNVPSALIVIFIMCRAGDQALLNHRSHASQEQVVRLFVRGDRYSTIAWQTGLTFSTPPRFTGSGGPNTCAGSSGATTRALKKTASLSVRLFIFVSAVLQCVFSLNVRLRDVASVAVFDVPSRSLAVLTACNTRWPWGRNVPCRAANLRC